MTTLTSTARLIEARDEEGLKRTMHTSSDKLSVLAAGSEPMLSNPIEEEKFEHVIDGLMAKAPVVLADLSCADAPLKKIVLSRAQHIILVTSPMVTSLRLARAAMKEVAALRGGALDDISLVVNMQGQAKNHEVAPSDIEIAMDRKPEASIPFLPSTFIANESEARLILEDKDGLDVFNNALLPILKRTVSSSASVEEKGGGAEKSGFLGGFLTKITSK